MKQFIETIAVDESKPLHLEWHQRRVDSTMQYFYPGHNHSWQLEKCIEVPEDFQNGLVKCRILYDAHHFSIHYSAYTPKNIASLKLVQLPQEFDYRYKYADRSMLEHLYGMRDDADDVLLAHENWITDSSVANIAFKKKGKWYTPSNPLLAGTTWKRLIMKGILKPRPINLKELQTFEAFKVFNALHDFETAMESPVGNIR